MNCSSGQDARRRDRHGWNDLDHYLSIHFAQLKRLGEYIVERDELEIDLTDADTLRIKGRIYCVHSLFLDVAKTLEINDRHQVRTIRYKYHAGILGETPRSIFRYDNAHPYTEHPDDHHKHFYDLVTWQEVDPPQWVGRNALPTLAEVLEELYDWWNETGQFL